MTGLIASLVFLLGPPPAPKPPAPKPPADAPAARPRPRDVNGMPVFPGARPVELEGALSAGGVPLDAALFETDKSVDAVLSFYKEELRRRGLEVSEHRFGPQGGYVGYFDPAASVMRLANAVGGPHATTIVLSSMNPAPLLLKGIQMPDDLPGLPGMSQVVHTESQEGSTRSRTVSFSAPGTPAEVGPAMVRAAREKGFERAALDREISADSLTLKRGNEVCIIRLLPTLDARPSVPRTAVTLMVVEER